MMDERAEKMSAYEAQQRRMRETYGPDAEMPKTPYGLIGEAVHDPVNEISNLSKSVTDAAYKLTEARRQAAMCENRRREAEAAFAQLTADLERAIAEVREGTPENVPYPH